LSVQADWGRVRIVGQASLEGYGTELAPLGTEPDSLPLNTMPPNALPNALPDTLSGQFRVSELSLNPNALFDAPLTLTRGAEVDLHLALNPFTLRLGRIWVDDDRLPLHASGVVRADPSGWTVSLDGRVDQIDAQDVLSFWPPEFQAKPRRWVAGRVTQATLHDAQFALRVVPGAPLRRFADFGLSDGVIRFHDDFPPIHVAQGRVSFDDARMTAVVDRGHIIEPGWGVLRMDGSRMAIADTTQKPAQGRFDLQGQGDMGPWLALLDRGRIRAMSRMGKTPDLATGRARVQGWLAMPLRRGVRGPDMRWDFQARLSDVATDRLIPNRRLSASQLDLRVTKADIVLRGTAQLDGVPMTGSWTQPLAQQPGQPVPPGVVRANVPISAQTLSTLKITLPKNMVQGQTQGALRVDLGPRGTPPRFALTSDLVGLSARIAPLGWQLGRRQRGELSVSGVLARPVRVDNITLRAAGLNAVGQVALRPDGSFAQLRLDPFALSSAQGRWLNGQVTIEGRGAGRPVAIAVSQGTVDMRRAPKGLAAAAAGGGSGAGAGPQMGPLSLGLRRLRLSDGMALTNVVGSFEAGSGLRGPFRAQINDGPTLSGEAVPTAQGTALRLKSADTSKILRAMGLSNKSVGGALEATLVPRGGGQYDGQLSIRDMRVRDSPAIVTLLDAVSVVGLIDRVQGPGIVFNEIDATFRLTPDRVIVTRSSATGPSMGVSLDGYYTRATGALDLQGVLSPLYALNGIGQILTRKGEGLVGFNFNIGGSASRPRVRVNPFSLLTPGMFREIFRRPPPKVSN
ncbi:MAG: hypothetical protein ACPG7W_05575, partial [Paracoccaceae bacterium]